MEIYAVIIYIIFYFIILAGLPPFIQWRAFQENIDVKYFKKVKITKLSFLFRGIGGKNTVGGNVKKDGVIMPMFVLQITGYCVAIISTVVILTLYLMEHVSYIFVIVFQSSLIGAEAISCIIMMYACALVTKKRKNQEESIRQKETE